MEKVQETIGLFTHAESTFRRRSYYLQIQVADNQRKCLCFSVTKVTPRDGGGT